MKNRPRSRRARPLLAAAGSAITAIAVSACTSAPGPFGNLRAPDCDLGQCPPPADLSVPDLNPPADLANPDHD
jgi:hypothetical protein